MINIGLFRHISFVHDWCKGNINPFFPMTVKIQSMCFFFSNHRGPQVPGAYLLMFKSCESTVFFGPTQEKSSQNQDFFPPEITMKWKIMSLAIFQTSWAILENRTSTPPRSATRMDITIFRHFGWTSPGVLKIWPFFRHHGVFPAKIWGGVDPKILSWWLNHQPIWKNWFIFGTQKFGVIFFCSYVWVVFHHPGKLNLPLIFSVQYLFPSPFFLPITTPKNDKMPI